MIWQRMAGLRSAFQCNRQLVGQHLSARTGIGRNIYRDYYDRTGCIFIHIPKCAGTSISRVLYGHSPWHYTAAEVRSIDPAGFQRAYRFSIVRQPLMRLYSAYNYAPTDVGKYNFSPIKFMLRFKTFEEFVERGLSERLVNSVRFLQPQTTFLLEGGSLLVDDVIKFEELPRSLARIARSVPVLEQSIPHLNSSGSPLEVDDVYSAKMKEIVQGLYAADLARFAY